jgi:hypothetical protein
MFGARMKDTSPDYRVSQLPARVVSPKLRHPRDGW